ncbi:hypothetical protein BX070DRAFT_4228 [Coemansia spiralis]|nr:hypothetical protein BX070DRAFT_4228 [Coemansia spiralis]
MVNGLHLFAPYLHAVLSLFLISGCCSLSLSLSHPLFFVSCGITLCGRLVGELCYWPHHRADTIQIEKNIDCQGAPCVYPYPVLLLNRSTFFSPLKNLIAILLFIVCPSFPSLDFNLHILSYLFLSFVFCLSSVLLFGVSNFSCSQDIDCLLFYAFLPAQSLRFAVAQIIHRSSTR